MKTFTYFIPNEKYNLFQSIRDKLFELDSLIYWKFFRIIFESIYFNKTVS